MPRSSVVEAASTSLGMTATAAGVRDASDIERVLTAFAQETDGGLIIMPSPMTATRRDLIVALAAGWVCRRSIRSVSYASGRRLDLLLESIRETVREAASYAHTFSIGHCALRSTPHVIRYGRVAACPRLPEKKRRRTEVSVPTVGGLVPSAGTITLLIE